MISWTRLKLFLKVSSILNVILRVSISTKKCVSKLKYQMVIFQIKTLIFISLSQLLLQTKTLQHGLPNATGKKEVIEPLLVKSISIQSMSKLVVIWMKPRKMYLLFYMKLHIFLDLVAALTHGTKTTI